MIIERHFTTLDTPWGSKQIHYRRCGSGPAVLLLHQSPQSSAEYEPLMRDWADRFTVFAPDYPGFGMSDPLGADGELELTLDDFAEVLLRWMDVIGLDAAGAYGFHTGAGMAVALAAAAPERITAVYANGYVVLNQAEQDEILRGYLPPFKPAWDGSHLLWLWTRNRDQLIFFPWFDRRAEARIARTVPPPAVLHDWALELLRADDHYRVGYRAAFTYPGDVPLRTLKTQAIITATATDVLGAYLERITAPAPSVAVRVGGTMQENLDEAAAFFQCWPGSQPPPAPPTQPLADRPWNLMLDAAVRVRCCTTGTGTPLVLLHELGGACETLEPLLAACARERPTAALDLPGHGESVGLAPDAEFVARSVEQIGRLLGHLGWAQADLLGIGGGGVVALACAQALPGQVRRVAVRGLPYLDAAAAAEQAAHFAPQIAPDWHGGYLLEYWHVARNQALFWPWYRQEESAALGGAARVGAAELHTRTVALLKAAPGLAAAAAAVFGYPLDGALRELSQPLLLAAAPSDPHFAHTRAAAENLPGLDVVELNDDALQGIDQVLEFLNQE